MMLESVELCGICATVGKSSRVKVYQINLKEAVKLCEDEACNYPIGTDKLVQRKFEDVPVPAKRKNMQRHSLQPPIFSANQNGYHPRPQPLHMSSKAPCNIIRPQPVSAFPPPNSLSPMTSRANLPIKPGTSPLSSVPAQFSTVTAIPKDNYASEASCNVLTSDRDPSQENTHGFHPLNKKPLDPVSQNGSLDSVSQNSFIDSVSQNGFMDPDSEMDIDTSEVREFIDVHFSSNDRPAIIEVLTTNKTSDMSVNNLNQSNSDDALSLKSVSTPSSPFIPVRSNVGGRVEANGIKPLVSNNATDTVISQEIEIQTSGSPLLGDHATYFVIEGAKKRRGRKPKPKDEKTLNTKTKKVKRNNNSDNLEPCENPKPPEKCIEKSIPTLDIYKYFPQWQNEEALCWLDVVLCLFVHSKTIRKVEIENENVDLSNTILVTLFKAYHQACRLVNKHREKSYKENSESERHRTRSGRLFSDPEESDSDALTDSPSGEMMNELCKSFDSNSIKTGAGLSCSKDLLSMLPSDSQENYKRSFSILKGIREEIWKKMEPRLQCVKGKNDSPVLAIPLMVKDNVFCEKHFAVEYDFILKCDACGYQQKDRYRRVLPTFPSTDANFSMKDPSFLRSCFKCNAENQKRVMKIIRLPEVLLLHFAEGLPHSNFKKLQFTHHNVRYNVTGFIQYCNDPDHFVTWIHNTKDNKWMEFDDLKSPITKFESRQPDIDPKQIHVVMWETTRQKEVLIDNSSQLRLLKKLKGISTPRTGKEHCTSLIDIAKVPILNIDNGKAETDTFTDTYHNAKTIKKSEIKQFTNGTPDLTHRNKSVTINSQSKQTLTSVDNNNSQCVQNFETEAQLEENDQTLSLHDSAVKVRNAKLKNKIQKQREQPEVHSKRIIDKVLKSMSDKSNVVFTQKTEDDKTDNFKFTPNTDENQKTDLRKALSKLWKPTAETATKIKDAQSKKAKMSAPKEKLLKNKWEPVDKVELTKKKYRGKLILDEDSDKLTIGSSETRSELVGYDTKSNLVVATTDKNKNTNQKLINDEKIKNRGNDMLNTLMSESLNQTIEIPRSDKRSHQPNNNIMKEFSTTKKQDKVHCERNGILGHNIVRVPLSTRVETKDSSSSTCLTESYNKAQNGRRQNKNSCLTESFNTAPNGRMQNKNSTCLNEVNNRVNGIKVQNSELLNKSQGYELPGSRASSRSSLVSVSEPRKTFTNFRRKTFSSFKSASMAELNEPSAPSPTNSTKSEFIVRTKRKLSVDNFITVKKYKPQRSFARYPSYALNSTGNSIHSSPGAIQTKESDILQDLYNALDIPIGNHGNTESMDLSAIENSSCLQDMDDFLDQLL